ncbi:MAG TPA: glycoside hydrolase family 9 protein [Candidatus Kryptonia bacterium]
MSRLSCLFVFSFVVLAFASRVSGQPLNSLRINDLGYYELQSLNVMVFDDFYPEGHQGGITIVQFGERVAANGDVRIDPTPGQWSPVPKLGSRTIDRKDGTIKVTLWYPDSSRNEKGYNPIDYPDLAFKYTIITKAVGTSLRVMVNLDKPLPDSWSNKIGFNLELYPGRLFGEHYFMDGNPGIFPRQVDSPVNPDSEGQLQVSPMAVGRELIVAPGNNYKEIKIVSLKSNLELLDGRGLYNNGWFVLRSTIPAGVTTDALEWTISPGIDTTWRYKPVVQVSQVGYAPAQIKFAVIELDKLTDSFTPIELIRIDSNSERVVKSDSSPSPWGNFLRYKYLRFDFTDIKQTGLYKIRYGSSESNEFLISDDAYANDVWQPTLEYFLPEQMCHMKVEDRYRVWHGLCHMDDATMAPINEDHFDGYFQGPSTLTKYKSGEHVPGLNIGGWHDAGDYDLRIESQAETVYKLALAYELFGNNFDQTSIDENARLTELHKPDGKPDILQQVEHGLLSIIGSYESLGRLYRGIQEATLHQYTLLGDGENATDNLVYKAGETDPVLHRPLPQDDRIVFTEKNPRRELYVASTLAAAYRVMKKFDPAMAEKCIEIAERIYDGDSTAPARFRINAAAELFLSTSNPAYARLLLDNADLISKNIMPYSIVIGRVVRKLDNPEFKEKIEAAVRKAFEDISKRSQQNPYGVPYEPYIWGAGWEIQSFGVEQLFLYLGFPSIFKSDYVFNALDFVLGCHPGENTSSFASGVGARSMTVAYGANRDDWSYIPGGIASGTALIRPDLPELKTWPYFWQQGEYVLGGGATDFILLSMAADYLFNNMNPIDK